MSDDTAPRWNTIYSIDNIAWMVGYGGRIITNERGHTEWEIATPVFSVDGGDAARLLVSILNAFEHIHNLSVLADNTRAA